VEKLEPGRTAEVTLTVAHADTAIALASGEVAVLSTPRVLALAEQAAVTAVKPALPPEETSVGAWVELDHLAPTPVGETVRARATLVRVEGRRLEFDISVHQGETLVARVRHRRAVVARSAFPA
jgi:predicted thioesterase